jgi:hypothetical protein
VFFVVPLLSFKERKAATRQGLWVQLNIIVLENFSQWLSQIINTVAKDMGRRGENFGV